jgi:hypothetical protein
MGGWVDDSGEWHGVDGTVAGGSSVLMEIQVTPAPIPFSRTFLISLIILINSPFPSSHALAIGSPDYSLVILRD